MKFNIYEPLSLQERGAPEAGVRSKIALRVIIKYTLLQLPAAVILAFVLYFLHSKTGLPLFIVWPVLAIWIVKDIIMFPFVWRAYDSESGHVQYSMIGRTGITKDPLDPEGYIRVNNELWQAKTSDNSVIAKDREVIIIDMKGLVLIVRPVCDE